MKYSSASILASALLACAAASAQERPAIAQLPLSTVVLYSSGVAYFERRGQVSGDAELLLPFAAAEVNDALKSLVVTEYSGGRSSSPSISYPSREGLERALKDFRIDLSGSPDLATILSRLRGAEISIDAPDAQTGRIVAVESRQTKEGLPPEPYLLILGKTGLRSIALAEAQSLRFSDPELSADFGRALELILASRDERSVDLELRLPGSGAREASVGYVVAAPVWKVSYRLDLSPAKPLMQGWAIVDNSTGQDWKGVRLSLVSGRPVSFVQDLYGPYYVDRPTLPLAIAGAASARSLDSGLSDEGFAGQEFAVSPNALSDTGEKAPRAAGRAAMKSFAEPALAGSAPATPAPALAMASAQSLVAAAQAESAGQAFRFTALAPVSLERGRSAMIPLVSSELGAERVSVYSPGSKHPMLGARLSNDTGMALPAGPISVFDGGAYAGDALLEYLAEKDRRLIVFGDDLGVTANAVPSSSEELASVSISKGAMTLSRWLVTSSTYSFKNATADRRRLVVEHPIAPDAELVQPAAFDEKTASVYRFSLDLPPSAQASLVVKERSPRRQSVVLSSLGSEDFLAYASSKDLPQSAKDALKKAMDFKKKVEDAKQATTSLDEQRSRLEKDQARYRDNLEAVGRDSAQGKEYLKRLMDAETAIDQTAAKAAEAQKALQAAQKDYDSYIGGLSL
jgi:hypothetical protein